MEALVWFLIKEVKERKPEEPSVEVTGTDVVIAIGNRTGSSGVLVVHVSSGSSRSSGSSKLLLQSPYN